MMSHLPAGGIKEFFSERYRLPRKNLQVIKMSHNFALAFRSSGSKYMMDLYLGEPHYIHFGNPLLMLDPLAGVSRIYGFPHLHRGSISDYLAVGSTRLQYKKSLKKSLSV